MSKKINMVRIGRACSAMAILMLALGSGPARAQYAPASPVDNYSEPPPVYLMDEERTVLEALAEVEKAFNGATLELDPGLVLMARDLAHEIQGDPFRQTQILSSAKGTELKDRYGIYDSSTRSSCYMFRGNTDISALIKGQFSPGRAIYSHLGAGAVPENSQGQAGVIVVLISSRLVAMDPFPRKVETGSTMTLKGRLINQVSDYSPRVLVTPPGGQVKRLKVTGSNADFSAPVTFDQGSGTYRVEVVAKADGDSKMAALLVVEAAGGANGRNATFEITGFSEPPVNEAQAEQMVLEMINQVRVKEGLGPLRDDWHLQQMAKAHSRDMKKNKYVGHRSPEFGPLEQRKIAAGLGAYLVLENVAQNTGLPQAMDTLLQSPAHRAAIIAPPITHVGVGVCFDDSSGTRHYYLTQDFGKLN